MTATADTRRVLILENFQLRIALTQRVNADGTDSYFWSVQQGPRLVNSGGFDGPHTHDLTGVLKHIVDSVTTGSSVMDIELRSLTWKALPGFDHVPAHELEPGDFVGGTVQLAVQAVQRNDDNTVSVRFHGSPLARRWPLYHLCNVAVTP